MRDKRIPFLFILAFLLLLTLACEISFAPSAKDNTELSEGEILMTDQVELQLAVEQTVAAMGLDSDDQENGQESDDSQEDVEQEDIVPTETPLPCNKPKFQGETIPDNSKFDPGESFTKTWTVRNDGTCTWTTDYSLVFASGDKMGGPSAKSFSSNINPGETVTLSVDLTAPTSDGAYTGTWKIKANDGEQFGNYWTTIVVGEPASDPGAPFAVTGVIFGGDQMKVGFCPHTFNLTAEIAVNGPGKVKYHWVISNGYEGPVETITFNSAGAKTVNLSKSISCGGTCPYIVTLYIDSPNHQMFGNWPIVVHCI